MIKDDGSAFPSVYEVLKQDEFSWVERQLTRGGMSLRDYFAAAALSGILSNHVFGSKISDAERVSLAAWEYADAMIAEREKQ